MKKLLLFSVCILITFPLFTQGKLMLVGGGTEDYDSWSDTPFQWAVDQAANDKVAVITFETNPSNWIPDYFIDKGAAEATNFSITTFADANSQETYDDIVDHDLIFIKGGDQYNYINAYSGSLLIDAIQEVYDNGGVVSGTSAGMAILSDLIFTAENGTVYPEEMIEDPFNQWATIDNGLFDFVGNAIFDTHFVERGRFARLIGFVAHLDIDGQGFIHGVGVDDRTALCIDENLLGTVYGSAAVTFFLPDSDTQFDLSDGKLVFERLKSVQLVHEQTIDLASYEVQDFNEETPLTPALPTRYNKSVYLSGTDEINLHQEMVDFLIEQEGLISGDQVITVTGNTADANDFQVLFDGHGFNTVTVNSSTDNPGDAGIADALEASSLIVFLENDYDDLFAFLSGGQAGTMLSNMLYDNQTALAFVGGDSRLAGKTYVHNYDLEYASYDGNLEVWEGLSLLEDMVVMPNSFSTDIDIESAAAGVPFAMDYDTLRYGLWLHGASFARYGIVADDYIIEAHGDYPVLIAERTGLTRTTLAQRPVYDGDAPRQVAGYDEMVYAAVHGEHVKPLGSVVTHVPWSDAPMEIRFYPNPFAEFVLFETTQDIQLRVMGMDGRLVFSKTFQTGFKQVDLKGLNPGVYLFVVNDIEGNNLVNKKLIKQ